MVVIMVRYTYFISVYIYIYIYIYIQGVQKVPVRLNIFSGKIIITEVKVISEVTFNEEFNGDL